MRSLTEILENKPGSSDKELVRRYVDRYSLRHQPVYQCWDYTDYIQDDNCNDFECKITYNHYNCEDVVFGFCKRVVEYTVEPLGDYVMSKESLNESLRNSIMFHAGGTVVFEVSEFSVTTGRAL